MTNLRILAARVSRAFAESSSEQLKIVQKVKGDELRDVVTPLDEKLHVISEQFVAEHLPGTDLLSEEGAGDVSVDALLRDDLLVVDPLDGSNNYALSLPGYGFMAAHLRSGQLVGSVVVLPEYDVYLLANGDGLITSQPFSLGGSVAAPSGTVYYAYPPRLGDGGRLARAELLDVIDSHTSGLYRSGSACIGLANLVMGKHRAFVAHHVRIWDVLAWLPILHHLGYTIRYRMTPSAMVLVASLDPALVDFMAEPIERCDLNCRLSSYDGNQLVVTHD